MFLFPRLQRCISTHKQSLSETKAIPISLWCRLLPLVVEMFSPDRRTSAGSAAALCPKLAIRLFGIPVMIALAPAPGASAEAADLQEDVQQMFGEASEVFQFEQSIRAREFFSDATQPRCGV